MIDVDQIDADFVPRLRAHVATVPVADEAVLYEEDTGVLHQLNATAVAVSAYFDGRTPLRTAIDELSANFGAAPEVVRDDVLAMVRDLARKGLFEGVGDGGGERVDDGH